MKKILIIDDEQSVRESFRVILSGDYSITAASDSEQALKAFEDSRWNLIILDAIMPGIEYAAAAKKLKKFNPDTPVLMLTSSRTLKIAAEAVKHGAEGYITKPIDVKEIQSVVGRLLDADDKTCRRKPESDEGGLLKTVERFEREMISAALAKNNGVQTRAAKELDISRRVLKYKMDKLDIRWDKNTTEDDFKSGNSAHSVFGSYSRQGHAGRAR